MYIRSASSLSTVLWAFHTIQPSSLFWHETSVWLCRIPHSYALIPCIAPSSLVCRSVCRSVSLSHKWVLIKRLKRSRCHLRSRLGWAQRTTCYMSSRGQHGKGQFWVVNRQAIVKYRDTPQSSVQTQLNRSIWRFGCGLEWAVGCTSSIVFARWRQCALMGGHVAVTCQIKLNHPSTAAMRLMSNYFDHTLSLDTPT